MPLLLVAKLLATLGLPYTEIQAPSDVALRVLTDG